MAGLLSCSSLIGTVWVFDVAIVFLGLGAVPAASALFPLPRQGIAGVDDRVSVTGQARDMGCGSRCHGDPGAQLNGAEDDGKHMLSRPPSQPHPPSKLGERRSWVGTHY